MAGGADHLPTRTSSEHFIILSSDHQTENYHCKGTFGASTPSLWLLTPWYCQYVLAEFKERLLRTALTMLQNMAATTTELWPSIANTMMSPWKHTTSIPPRRSGSSKDKAGQNEAVESQQVCQTD